MSKKIYLFSLVLLALAFASCEETKEEGKYDNWRARNEAFIDEKKNTFETAPNHGGLSRIELISAPGDYIYYKDKTLEAVPSKDLTTDKNILGKNPTFTATVKLYYKGTNILDEYFDGNFIGNDPVATPPGEKKKRDANVGDSTPREFTVSQLIQGWQEVLQQMKVGERWEVYIPWEYGYGSSGNEAILGYSTLVFDIQLLDADSVHETEAPKQNK